jgi:hypothetical protein
MLKIYLIRRVAKMKLKFSQLAKAVLCTAAMAVSALGSMTISASAADNINVDIVCKNDTTTVSNAEWSIYKVGERKEADFVLTGEFSDYPIDMSDFTDASKMQAVADTLDNYAKTDGITPVSTGKTDANGEVKLSADSVGLYLVSGKSFENTTAKFTPSPSLIEIDKDIVAEGQITVYTKFTYEEIPAGDSDYGVRKSWIVPDGQEKLIPDNIKVEIYRDGKLFDTVTLNADNNWEYFWKDNSYTKFTYEEIPAGDSDYGVRKSWIVPDGQEKLIPDNIKVEIYRDGKLFDTVTLNADNNWEYFWKDNSAAEWTVKEIDIPANYTVVTKNNDKLFLIENTYKSDSSSNTDSSSSTPDSSSSGSDSSSSTPDNIPQTGSLNWPVPVLIGGGVILIAAGWRVSRKEK